MSTIALAACHAPGYTMVYKGLDQARLNGLFDANGHVDRIAELLSSGRGDFSRLGAYYFVIDREIAVYYASYAKRRDSVDSVVIVHMAIPNAAIESLSETEFVRTHWPSPEWKNLVFHCRRGDRLPTSLRKFKQATLIIGTIAKTPNQVYSRLDSPNQITSKWCSRPGMDATQFSTFGPRTTENSSWSRTAPGGLRSTLSPRRNMGSGMRSNLSR